MANPTGYPKVSAKAWQVLRTRAAAAPSTKFTPSTVAALLDLSSPKSAADNVVYPMRRLGLFTDEDALTERGNKWRLDESYPEACQEILDDVYPSELAALTTEDGSPDKARINTWLQHKGLGGSNANQMAATYALIASKVPPDQLASTTPKKESSRKPVAKPKATEKHTKPSVVDQVPAVQTPSGTSTPVVHLDIQIHIPAAADAEQIDQIFASMAKHLYR